METYLNKEKACEEWLVDSGCTNYMTNDKELFNNIQETNITEVWIGNGDSISVIGKGSITLESLHGSKGN